MHCTAECPLAGSRQAPVRKFSWFERHQSTDDSAPNSRYRGCARTRFRSGVLNEAYPEYVPNEQKPRMSAPLRSYRANNSHGMANPCLTYVTLHNEGLELQQQRRSESSRWSRQRVRVFEADSVRQRKSYVAVAATFHDRPAPRASGGKNPHQYCRGAAPYRQKRSDGGLGQAGDKLSRHTNLQLSCEQRVVFLIATMQWRGWQQVGSHFGFPFSAADRNVQVPGPHSNSGRHCSFARPVLFDAVIPSILSGINAMPSLSRSMSHAGATASPSPASSPVRPDPITRLCLRSRLRGGSACSCTNQVMWWQVNHIERWVKDLFCQSGPDGRFAAKCR